MLPDIVRMEWKLYRCSQCNHFEKISTNHEGSCMSYCSQCSWRGFTKDAPGYRTFYRATALEEMAYLNQKGG